MDLLSEVLINFKEVILGACGGVVANLYHFIKKKDAGKSAINCQVAASIKLNGIFIYLP